MSLALHILFWLWCAVLLVVGSASVKLANSLSGESGGPAMLAFGLLCGVLLMASLALRVLL